MSYDIEFGLKVEGLGKVVKVANGDPDQPTYNIRELVIACSGWNYEQGKWYKFTDVLPFIKQGIREMLYHSNKYKQYLPSNGWGDYDTVRDTLQGMLNVAKELGEYNEIPVEYLYVRW